MRFELIILTVFVMIFMLDELVAGSCPVGQWEWSGHCFNCQCHWENAKIKGSCKGDGSCTCLDKYKGPTCSTCIRSYFTLDTGGCAPCGCSKYGATSVECARKVGQGADLFCNCRKGYKGKQCDECKANYYPSNGACCDKQSWCFSKSQEKCIDCAGNTAKCDVSKCECKYSYTGTDCQGAKERTRKLTWNVFQNNTYDGRYRVTGIHCYGNCDIISLTMTLKGDIDMTGSTAIFRQSKTTGRFQTTGQFCRGISYSDLEEKCLDDNDKTKVFKGTVNSDTIHVMHYIGRAPFNNPEFNYRVGNFKGVFESDVPFDSTFT